MSGLVTLGEQLGQVTAGTEGPLRPGAAAQLSVCGAEANVAIGVRRLGFAAAYVGRVGDDAFGRMALDVLRGEGVDVTGVRVDPAAPTGLLLRSRRTADRTVVEYLRSRSAGSRLTAADLDEDVIAGAGLLHVTGITPALSPTAAKAVDVAVDIARAAGVPVSLDVNYRAALWSPDEARPELRRLASRADVVIGGPAELALLGGDEQLEHVAELGPTEVVRTEGASGATAFADGTTEHVAAHDVRVVDVVGAGDAFVAGYLAARLDGRSVGERLRLGVLLGAFAVGTWGDWEGLPRRDELGLIEHGDEVLR
ncbi:2-dehydro-3-deoxygluconokinase [Jatrophihabitans endophyticus]|uniref:2-dehydro-3-deoxygluconokinase n=1 Tax=Jatrophihabitans endophyticus TaxID=1206085 RepID=A0A1M5S6J7_9ACTN|nr:sugar kinase [Jatrophihabitans endophyticus]SHH34227.1 2-dehydro-3-deoxygluconokinase [Jatrophihabitans endophyticus]